MARQMLTWSWSRGQKGGCDERARGNSVREVRISVSSLGSLSVVKVDGALTRDGLAELERVIAPCEGALQLDFTELRSLDEEALAAIRALRGNGAVIAGASPYIALLIGATSSPRGETREKEKTQ